MDRQEFARVALSHLRRARPTEGWELDEAAFALCTRGAEVHRINLGNFYDEHEHEVNKAEVFARLVRFADHVDSNETRPPALVVPSDRGKIVTIVLLVVVAVGLVVAMLSR